VLLADDHAGLAARARVRKRGAAAAGRDDVRANVAEGDEDPGPLERREPAEAAARDVLEEDALDRSRGAEAEDLLERRADEPCGRDEARL
jgi:hypothetical protein